MEKDFEQRVINLLKKADSVAGTPEEDAFRAKAMELIAKYNFDAATIRDKSQDKSEIIYKMITPKGHHVKSQINLYAALCQEHSVVVIQLGRSNTLKMYGTEEGIQQVEWLYSILWPNALTQALKVKPSWENYTKGEVTVARRSFLYGFIIEVRNRLREANKRVEEESHGAGLILMDDFRRAQAKLKEDHPNVVNQKTSRQVNGEAMANGTAAGKRSDIGQTRIKNTTRAIGA